jgi:hypothetical protein
MTAPVNARDVLLQAASPRLLPSYGTAAAALAAAQAAQQTANNAATSAQLANDALAIVFNDNILSRDEKPEVILKVAVMDGEFNDIIAKADALGVNRDAYYNSKVDLNTLLYTNNPTWNTLTVDTAITGTTFRAAFKLYYDAKTLLLNAIAAKSATTATGLTLGATGVLTGPGGAQGQMTALPTIDLGNGTFFGARNRNDPPSDYPVGTTRQFKTTITFFGSEVYSLYTYFVLETVKQYQDNTGGGAYQYAYINGLTFRRFTTQSANTSAGAWTAWVQDLDRNAYTGDLNASLDVTLLARGGGIVLNGNRAVRTSSSGWDSDVYSKNGFRGGSCASIVVESTSHIFMFGLNTDPTTDSSYNSIDFAMYCTGSAGVNCYESGQDRGAIGTCAVGDVLSVSYDGSKVVYMNGTTVMRTVTVDLGANVVLFFDSSIFSGAINGIRFLPQSSNNWGSVGGSNKPADNATADITLIAAGAGTVITGNSVSRTGQVGWDGGAFTYQGFAGGASVSFEPLSGGDWMAGLDSNPAQDSSYQNIDYALYGTGNNLYYYESGSTNSVILSGYATGDSCSVTYDGSTVIYMKNRTILRTVSANITAPLGFDSSIINGTLKNIRLVPLASNNFDAVGGPNKPANGATVGAPAGTLVAGVPAATVASGATSGAAAATALANPPTLAVISNISFNGASNSAGYVGYEAKTAVVSNGTAPFTYSWQVESYFGSLKLSALTGATVTVSGKAATNSFTSGYVTCTVRDAYGQTASQSFNVDVGHGSGTAP